VGEKRPLVVKEGALSNTPGGGDFRPRGDSRRKRDPLRITILRQNNSLLCKGESVCMGEVSQPDLGLS